MPDVITFGKGIGGGVVPLSGMVASRRVREVVETSPSGFSYGHTFSGNPLGCAVGCEVIDIVEQEGLLEAPPRSRVSSWPHGSPSCARGTRSCTPSAASASCAASSCAGRTGAASRRRRA